MGKIIGNGCSRDCGTVRILYEKSAKGFPVFDTDSAVWTEHDRADRDVHAARCVAGEKYGMPIITVPLFIMGALAGFNNIFKMAKKIYGQGDEGKRDHVEKTK